jgi:FtsZ-binding cell division protein ZapB
LQLEKNSKEVVATGLQHEIELLQQKNASLESTLHTERGHLSELRQDKEPLQKQLELLTLRLPAPKVGFWTRLFGGLKREKEA